MRLLPLTVIGGFLGAGKTTLINQLLSTATRRFGVLVNDFGAIAIDAALIAAREGGTVALTNGCVCCETGGDLGGGLSALAARTPPIEHVIVETSGVSDPRRVAQLALVERGFDLEPIIVVADNRALCRQLDDRWVGDTVRGQLMAADLVVLNKADQAEPGARDAIRGLRPGIPVSETNHGIVDVGLLRFPVAPRRRFHADTPVMHDFPTWHFIPQGSFDRDRLRAMLLSLPPSVLRVKGFCRLGPEAAPHLLQFASGEWALTEVANAEPGLVVIGTPLLPDGDALETLFRRAII